MGSSNSSFHHEILAQLQSLRDRINLFMKTRAHRKHAACATVMTVVIGVVAVWAGLPIPYTPSSPAATATLLHVPRPSFPVPLLLLPLLEATIFFVLIARGGGGT
jgi:hypothetical protein